MSKVNKRKHVMKEMQTDDFEPPESNQLIVRITSSRGNNLHEVESAEPIATADVGDGESGYRFLVTMPTKFRKNVWVNSLVLLLITFHLIWLPQSIRFDGRRPTPNVRIFV